MFFYLDMIPKGEGLSFIMFCHFSRLKIKLKKPILAPPNTNKKYYTPILLGLRYAIRP